MEALGLNFYGNDAFGFNSFTNPIASNTDYFNLFSAAPADYSSYFNQDFIAGSNLFNSFWDNKINFFAPPTSYFGGFTRTRTPSQFNDVYDAKAANNLASIAKQSVNRTHSTRHCYRGVKDILTKAGLNNGEIVGGSAYQAAEIFANHDKFKEVDISIEQAKNIPGLVVVWQPSEGHEKGHVEILTGDGQAVSDYKGAVTVRPGVQYNIFAPVGIDRIA